MDPNADLSETCKGSILVCEQVGPAGGLPGMQEACVQAHALLRTWLCPSDETHLHRPVSGSIANRLFTLCKTARIGDLIWKDALVDDLVLPAAQWPKDVFLLTYTGTFNLLLYWDLFDFFYDYHYDMLVESRAGHGLCTVPATNVIRLNYQGLSLGLLEITGSIRFVICEPLTATKHSQHSLWSTLSELYRALHTVIKVNSTLKTDVCVHHNLSSKTVYKS